MNPKKTTLLAVGIALAALSAIAAARLNRAAAIRATEPATPLPPREPAPSAPPSSTARRKTAARKVVVTAALLIVAASVLGGGTLATFTAQTRNPANVFANGTIVLSNTKQGGSACLSTGGGSTDTNANAACDQLLGVSVRKPGDSSSVNLTIKNEGSLTASVLKVFSTACTNANAAGESYSGTGLPCSKLQLSIQRFSDTGFSSPSACVYGGGTATTCDFSDAGKTLAAFQSAYASASSGLAIGSGLAAGASAYLQLAVKLPLDADNSYQGRQASIDFNWYAEQ